MSLGPARLQHDTPALRAALFLAVLVATLVGNVVLLPTTARAAAPVLLQPTASGSLGTPLTFETSFTSDEPPVRVDLLARRPADEADLVLAAQVSGTGPSYTARLAFPEDEGHIRPNTVFAYHFRVVTASGPVDGPEGRFTYADNRFQWRTLEGALVRLHWYSGDDAFAQHALQIGERGVARAATLLGVEEKQPIDFFIYASSADFGQALGPGTTENVGGVAPPGMRTLFALIEPSAINSTFVDEVIPHELTHLVFETATRNPYHQPPHWLNEGLAVYLEPGGYSAQYRSLIAFNASRGSLYPLQSFTPAFPPSALRDRFLLAYAEGVSAVDFFIRRYGEDRLVQLIRSYANGVTEDDAFREATGADFAAFNTAWLTDVGGVSPPEFGAAPAPSGPLPPDWAPTTPEPAASPGASGAASPAGSGHTSASASPGSTGSASSPTATSAAGRTRVATSGAGSGGTGTSDSGGSPSLVPLGIAIGALLGAAGGLGVALYQRARNRTPVGRATPSLPVAPPPGALPPGPLPPGALPPVGPPPASPSGAPAEPPRHPD